ncbi:hypothetical protein [Brevundimonas sp.]|uniref:rolling circle replication-associated protein n=1 Tax=Brevundimonas sp. TaxID=1871086 RepID=UPI00391B25FB
MKLARKQPRPAFVGLGQAIEKTLENPVQARICHDGPSPYIVAAHVGGFVPLPGRGGARNRADRRSEAISEGAARNLIEAARYAKRAGIPLNRFTTVHWQEARVADDLGALAQFLKLAGDWVRSRGGRLAYVWVRENGPRKGAHVHILLHLPPDLARAFNGRQRGWLKACGAQSRKGVLLSRPIGRSLRHGVAGGGDYQTNLGETLDYVLKGADHRARSRLGVRRCEAGGEIIGKRCGVSQNIGPGARRAKHLW